MREIFLRLPPLIGCFPAFSWSILKIPLILKEDSVLNEMISLSLSTISLTATDCTLPADKRRLYFFPENRRDLKTYKSVKNAAGLLGIDKVHVDLPRSENCIEMASFVIS